jgi:hypothetical protein
MPAEKFFLFLAQLEGHIKDEHKDKYEFADVKAIELKGMLIMHNYTGNDPQVRDQINFYRWRVHQATLNISFDNGTLERKAKDVVERVINDATVKPYAGFLSAEIKKCVEQHIALALKEVRDALQEPDAYSLKPAEKMSILAT